MLKFINLYQISYKVTPSLGHTEIGSGGGYSTGTCMVPVMHCYHTIGWLHPVPQSMRLATAYPTSPPRPQGAYRHVSGLSIQNQHSKFLTKLLVLLLFVRVCALITCIYNDFK